MRNHAAHALFLATALLLPYARNASTQVPTTVDEVRITPANVGVGKLLELDNDTIAAASITLPDLLWYEYGINRDNIRGLTREQLNTRFDVVGKIDPLEKLDPKHHYRSALIHALLLNHFHLKAHEETESVPFTALVVASNPTKLTPGLQRCPCPRTISTHYRFASQNVPIYRFTKWLSQQLDTDILDRTNLRETYAIDFDWSPEVLAQKFPPALANRISFMSSSDELLELALSSQLGLAITTEHEQVGIVVIDYIELPASVIWSGSNSDLPSSEESPHPGHPKHR